MRFGSVCSGIEAASVAWPFWQAAWFSEIEPFPCAVLKHHYPEVPNHGDMTTLPARILSGEVEAPDVFCGGTPCQAFSVAGNRKSLDDARGNLSLTFCEIADAIDTIRSAAGQQPAIIFWENVPGVLNTKDNAFGCFLAGLAGETVPLEPPGGKWTDAGAVSGPKRTIAWRVLDAQYFGLAQRRRRVFVVASSRAIDPSAILFEWEGVRRDTAPSREARQATAGDVARSVALRGRDGGGTAELGDEVADCLRASGGGGDKPHVITVARGHRMMAFGEYADDETASTMKMRDYKDATDLVCAEISPTVTNGAPFSRTGNERVECDALVAVPAYGIPGNWIGRAPENGGNATEPMVDISPCLTTADKHGVATIVPPLFCHRCGEYEVTNGACDWCSRADAVSAEHPNMPPPHAFKIRGGCEGGGKGYLGQDEQAVTITCGHDQQVAVPVAFAQNTRDEVRLINGDGTLAGALAAQPGMKQTTYIATRYIVRRLTPTECERLQGFPDGYTNIPWRNKPEAPDGPRYKALGNSWAVPVVRWIGERINKSFTENFA